MPFDLVVFVLLGAFAGVLAGLLGVGGGLVIVPILAWVFAAGDMPAASVMHIAIGTSLATIVFTSLSSIRAHHRRGAVRWDLFRVLVPGILLGALLGAFLADLLPSDGLRKIFGIFALAVAAQMGLNLIPESRRGMPGRLFNGAVGGGIGLISAVVGVGGGTMTVPYLVWCNVAVRQAIATSAACGLPIAVAGSLGFLIAGWQETREMPAVVGYLHLPALLGVSLASVATAPLGAALAHRLPGVLLKRVFALLLVLLGIRMLW